MKILPMQAVELLRHGKVVAIPTETVYGLAGSLYSEEAIREIFSLKNRPANNPLIVHLSSIRDINDYVADYPPYFELLTNAFWPGPLTLILPAENIPAIATAGLTTAAFRIPSHKIAREILSLTGPLVIPSANLSGKPSSTSYTHVERDFGEDFPVVEGGICEKGVESTILIFKENQWQIARLGAVSAEDLQTILPYKPHCVSNSHSPICPGQLYRHYAPKAKLHLENQFAMATLILGFSDRKYPTTSEVWHLGPSNDPDNAAKELYRLLRELDLQEKEAAWIDTDFPHTGLWVTIRERMEKAAS